ncbi:MAG: GNAT family N-acetyltransferase [Candidatus Krumholzibacteriia bacterium]|nr:GNAT family N-acetyltransferase [bacterium]MCB9514383.1 GNAT family N-acetyltransferase [Candidatus Latescibacterota bacterium]MCB9516680.1 GNAT family N-acetyltransferase [Candidatus Latescibacterota bacterium]
MSAPQLRRLEAADLPAAIALWARAGIRLTLSDRLDELERLLAQNADTCLGAWDGGALVGAALGTFDGRRANLWHLAVAPERRGEDIATALMAAIEGVWRRMGVVKVNFAVEEANRGVLGFYEKLGYHGREDVFLVSKVLRED